ncbi:hypothetical protein BKA69DRAFT_1106346 [Paraphysoderma sedebokerense]|nr:hypothetical protein BKA69DRAFT_1106346 [Paraphysoderma sedebokerense]
MFSTQLERLRRPPTHAPNTTPAHLRFDDPKARAKTQKQQTLHRSPLPPSKTVSLFSHLPQWVREGSLTMNMDPETRQKLHPDVVRVGLMFAEGRIVGGNARVIAMLGAFKKLIHDYNTPAGTSLTRHLIQYVGMHVSYLSETRSLSIGMGNSIRYLKKEITALGIDIPDRDAKQHLINRIDQYIRERITLADEAIISNSMQKIHDGDVILTYARSSIVQKLLLEAHGKGIDFRVIVVDSRPKYEGKELLKVLSSAGIRCTYVMINAVGWAIQEATKSIVGAQGLLSNGSILSRVGTSQVLLMSHNHSIPTIILCETYKFTDKVQLDSFVSNELADPEELVSESTSSSSPASVFSTSLLPRSFVPLTPANRPINASASNLTSSTTNITGSDTSLQGISGSGIRDVLKGWKDVPNLKLLNLMYDVTPSDFVDVVIAEVGLIPCTAVPVVVREYQTTNG